MTMDHKVHYFSGKSEMEVTVPETKRVNQYEIWMLTYGLTGVGEKQRLG